MANFSGCVKVAGSVHRFMKSEVHGHHETIHRFGRIHGHNSFNSFNAFMNEKRKLQRTFFHQLLCPSFSKANLSSFPSPLWKYLYIISMSNLWGSPNQDVQWQKFPNKKTFQVWCAPPCLVFSSWRGGISFWLVGGDAVDGRNPKSS